MEKSRNFRSECDTCHHDTIHDVLYVKEHGGTEEIDEYFSIDWGDTWRLIQCRGCESISVRRDSWMSEDLDETGRPEVTTIYFPPRTFRELPDFLNDRTFRDSSPPEIDSLLRELYVCLQNDCRASAAMVMRAIFEQMMVERTGDHGSFTLNLNKFEAGGWIGREQKKIVESLLEVGHASIHRSFTPNRDDVVALVDILESILVVVYVQAHKAEEIRNRVPRRKAKKPDDGSERIQK